MPGKPFLFPSCLLSDCDGVIVDSEKIADAIMLDALQEAFQRNDLAEHMTDMFGRRVVDIIALLETRLGVFLGPARRQEIQQDIDARVAREAPAMPGVKDVYESLGIPVGVVSNSAPPRLHACVRQAGLADLVGRHMFSGDEVTRPKPAPDVYLLAARTLDATPSECLVIEDSVTGVSAARSAGMTVLGFLGGSHIRPDHGRMLQEAGALLLFDDMNRLPNIISTLAA